LLVDPGTSNYMDSTRDQMRGTAAHNTVAIDGHPQSIPGGPFQWRTRSDSRLHGWRHNPAFDWAEASHDAYAPLEHRRTLLRTSSGWFVVDVVPGRGSHTTETFWHFEPRWDVHVVAPGRIRATDAGGHVAWLLHDAGTAALDRGNEPLGRGWYAPIYGTHIPAWVADVRSDAQSPSGTVTWIGEAPSATPPAIERLPLPADAGDRVIAARVRAGDTASVVLVWTGEPAGSGARDARLPDYHTNARVLHYASRAGALVALDIIDGSHALTSRDGWISVTSDGPILELHVGLDAGTMDLQSFDPPARLRFDGDVIAGLRTIRLNGREWPLNSFSLFGAPLIVDASQWTAAGAPLAVQLA
jgi:hypothetical protein